jgi:hypothetical protein
MVINFRERSKVNPVGFLIQAGACPYLNIIVIT